MKKAILSLLIVSALAGSGYWFWQRYSSPSPAAAGGPPPSGGMPSPPATAVVTTRDIHFAVTAAGDIGPLDAVSVRPEIGGLISKLTLDIGDKVKKDDILFELNDKELQTEKISRLTEIAGAKLAVETQRLQLEKSRLNFDRLKKLHDDNLVARETFDNARIDYDLTQNSLAIASNRLETAQNALQQVEDKLIKTVIRAPFDCTILTRPVSVGQAVSGASGFNSGTEVFTVADLANMIITAHINQADVTRVKVGQAVTVEVEAVPGLKLTGQVDRIAPQATFRNAIKGFSVRVLLKDAEDAVRPGMTANLTIPVISADKVLAIPLGAVFNEQEKRFVYVKKADDTFERRPVQLGVADYDFAEVLQGLRDGEVVSLVAPATDFIADPATSNRTDIAASAKVETSPGTK